MCAERYANAPHHWTRKPCGTVCPPSGVPDGRGTYGLTWRSQDQKPAVQPYERVGLSIAGLAQLSARWPAARAYADKLAGFVRVLAVEEHSLFPDPNAVADTARELDSLLSKMFLEVADTSAFTVTAQVSCRVLQREPIYLGLFDPELPTAPSTTVTLSEYLQPYIGSHNAAEYLQVVAEQTPPEPVTITMPPSSLPQTLDYLTLVLREDPNTTIQSKWYCSARDSCWLAPSSSFG